MKTILKNTLLVLQAIAFTAFIGLIFYTGFLVCQVNITMFGGV